jgi:hypothetical protein
MKSLCTLLLSTLLIYSLQAEETASNFSTIEVEKIGPWNLTELKRAPAMRWLTQTGSVHALLYAGENHQGKSTEVFAYYASPLTLGEAKPGTKFPGVVLIHGGGGTAFAEWAHLWAKRGYAAIAMDLSGSKPNDLIFDAKGNPVAGQAHNPQSMPHTPR